MPHKHIFLSYRSTQAEFALKLAADLKNMGVRIWVDRLDIKPSEDWRHSLQNGINNCAALISVLTPDYVHSSYCQRELARADRLGYPIIPIVLQPVSTDEFPLELERKQYIDFSNWQDEHGYQERLFQLFNHLRWELKELIIEAPNREEKYLNWLIASLEASKRVIRVGEDEHPYRPLTPVNLLLDSHVLLSAGRSELPDRVNLAEFLTTIKQHPRFVVVGAPGAGKTAVLEHLVLQLAYQKMSEPDTTPLPVLVRLSEWSDEADFVSFIKSQWTAPADYHAVSGTRQIMLFLDGIDAIPDNQHDKVQQIRNWLASDQAPPNVVATCRHGEEKLLQLVGLPTVTISNLDGDKINSFVSFFLTPERASDFISQLSALSLLLNLRALTNDSLFLSLLIEIYDEHSLSSNLSDLFADLVRKTWIRERDRISENVVSLEELEHALAEMAFEQLGGKTLTYADAQKIAVNKHTLRFASRANLLEVEPEKVTFKADVLMSYFAARWVSSSGLVEEWLQESAQSRYLEPIVLFLSGMVTNPDELIQKVKLINVDLACKAITVGREISGSIITDIVQRCMDENSDILPYLTTMVRSQKRAVLTGLLEVMRSAVWAQRQQASKFMKTLDFNVAESIVDALDGLEPDMQEAASIAMLQLGDIAVASLVKLSQTDDATLNSNVLWAMGEIADRAFVPVLVDFLEPRSPELAKKALDILEYIHDPAAAPYIIELLSSRALGDPASETLKWMGKPVLPALIHAIDHAKISVQRQVIHLLTGIEDELAMKALISATYNDNVNVRVLAIRALRGQSSVHVLERLVHCLNDEELHKRSKKTVGEHALEIIETLNVEDADQFLEKWLMNNKKSKPSGKSASSALQRLTSVSRKGDRETQRDLERALRDPDMTVRLGAVKHAGRLAPSLAMPLVKIALNDPAVSVRETAVNVLALFNTDDARRLLLKALGDDIPSVVDGAARLLEQYGEVVVQELLEQLGSRKTYTRQVVVQLLGKLGSSTVIPALVECLNDRSVSLVGEKSIGEWAADSLRTLGTPDAVQAVEKWESTREPYPGTTQSFDGDDILNGLLQEVRDAEWGEREEAVKQLREYAKSLQGEDMPIIRDRLISLLSESDWVVRWAAIEPLAWLADEHAVPSIKRLLDDENWMIRVAAIRALMEIGDQSIVDDLITRIYDEHNIVREAALEALGYLGGTRAMFAIAQILKDEDPLLRLAAVEALAQIDHKDVIIALIKALKDEDTNVRWSAAYALRDREDERAVNSLILRLSDTGAPYWEDLRICDLAAQALRNIGTPQALHALNTWQKTNSAHS